MKSKPKPQKKNEDKLSKRETLAMHILAALVAKPNIRGSDTDYARQAVAYADAVIGICDGKIPLVEPPAKPV